MLSKAACKLRYHLFYIILLTPLVAKKVPLYYAAPVSHATSVSHAAPMSHAALFKLCLRVSYTS